MQTFKNCCTQNYCVVTHCRRAHKKALRKDISLMFFWITCFLTVVDHQLWSKYIILCTNDNSRGWMQTFTAVMSEILPVNRSKIESLYLYVMLKNIQKLSQIHVLLNYCDKLTSCMPLQYNRCDDLRRFCLTKVQNRWWQWRRQSWLIGCLCHWPTHNLTTNFTMSQCSINPEAVTTRTKQQ